MYVKAQQHESLDALLYRKLGASGSSLLEQVLEANPQITGLEFLPEGTLVEVSEQATQTRIVPVVSLWD